MLDCRIYQFAASSQVGFASFINIRNLIFYQLAGNAGKNYYIKLQKKCENWHEKWKNRDKN